MHIYINSIDGGVNRLLYAPVTYERDDDIKEA